MSGANDPPASPSTDLKLVSKVSAATSQWSDDLSIGTNTPSEASHQNQKSRIDKFATPLPCNHALGA